ncbi:DUF4149 domain-containing protein [Thiomicrorhabdus sediminis]|uniref:DUF4149 domain-containing protein n=1 Tax=Thiomicrorhabdus sediminis TaxID=2580412 RepID=A0A4P9K6V8_9GAMM|nr:DUF4149 domain-containing protein [Thiomicrorhabdus sediminis]QCU89977.1 DUF4149 domain-containing protein [Thiomicrorhabdus sediminis]
MIKNTCFYWQAQFKVSLILALLLMVLGYVVTPILFASFNERQAGEFAAVLFNLIAVVTVLLLLGLLVIAFKLRLVSLKTHWSAGLAFMLMLSLLFYFAPEMASIKVQNSMQNLRESLDWPRFAALHGIYQLGYLVVIAMLILQTWQSRKMIEKSCA